MVTTGETKVKRIPIREFLASVKADMELPVIVTSDGQDAFAVLSFDLLREWHRRLQKKAVCPRCVERRSIQQHRATAKA